MRSKMFANVLEGFRSSVHFPVSTSYLFVCCSPIGLHLVNCSRLFLLADQRLTEVSTQPSFLLFGKHQVHLKDYVVEDKMECIVLMYNH